jgi:predicted AAA+ superfamily ATPase
LFLGILFLWGARQTGKSTLLEILFPTARYYDLLKSEEFERFFRRPALLREELENVNPHE